MEVLLVSQILALLDKAAPQTSSTRPKDAFDCALSEYGCDGWVKPEYAVLKVGIKLVGLCPRQEIHNQIAAGSKEAATVRGRITSRFRANAIASQATASQAATV